MILSNSYDRSANATRRTLSDQENAKLIKDCMSAHPDVECSEPRNDVFSNGTAIDASPFSAADIFEEQQKETPSELVWNRAKNDFESGPKTESKYHANGVTAETKITNSDGTSETLQFDQLNRLTKRVHKSPALNTVEEFSSNGQRTLLERSHYNNGKLFRQEEIRPDGHRIMETLPDGSIVTDIENPKHREQTRLEVSGHKRLIREGKTDDSIYLEITYPPGAWDERLKQVLANGIVRSFQGDKNSEIFKMQDPRNGQFLMWETDKLTGIQWQYTRRPEPGAPIIKVPNPHVTKGA